MPFAPPINGWLRIDSGNIALNGVVSVVKISGTFEAKRDYGWREPKVFPIGGWAWMEPEGELEGGERIRSGWKMVGMACLIPEHSPSSTSYVYNVRDGNRDYNAIQFCCWAYPDDIRIPTRKSDPPHSARYECRRMSPW